MKKLACFCIAFFLLLATAGCQGVEMRLPLEIPFLPQPPLPGLPFFPILFLPSPLSYPNR